MDCGRLEAWAALCSVSMGSGQRLFGCRASERVGVGSARRARSLRNNTAISHAPSARPRPCSPRAVAGGSDRETRAARAGGARVDAIAAVVTAFAQVPERRGRRAGSLRGRVAVSHEVDRFQVDSLFSCDFAHLRRTRELSKSGQTGATRVDDISSDAALASPATSLAECNVRRNARDMPLLSGVSAEPGAPLSIHELGGRSGVRAARSVRALWQGQPRHATWTVRLEPELALARQGAVEVHGPIRSLPRACPRVPLV